MATKKQTPKTITDEDGYYEVVHIKEKHRRKCQLHR